MTMRLVVAVLAALLLASCTQATASRIDARTYHIEGPPMSEISDGPNRRKADAVCNHNGYYVLSSETHKGGADRATYENDQAPVTTWTIRCIH